jgi:hypothetical protein
LEGLVSKIRIVLLLSVVEHMDMQDTPQPLRITPELLARLQNWEGRSESQDDVVTSAQVRGLAATLDSDDAPGVGQPVYRAPAQLGDKPPLPQVAPAGWLTMHATARLL